MTEFYIPIGKNKKVFVVNTKSVLNSAGSDRICCIAEHKLKDFLEMYKTINAYGDSYKGETGLPTREQDICLVHCNGQWHRAYLCESFGNGRPGFCLIDIFSYQEISVNHVIPMPKIFENPLAMGELCKVKGYAEIKKNSPNLIEELKMIEVDEIKIEKNKLVLHFNQQQQ